MVPANRFRRHGRGSFRDIRRHCRAGEPGQFRELKRTHHHLRALRPARYVARDRDRWQALAVLTAPALKYWASDR